MTQTSKKPLSSNGNGLFPRVSFIAAFYWERVMYGPEIGQERQSTEKWIHDHFEYQEAAINKIQEQTTRQKLEFLVQQAQELNMGYE